MDREPVLHLENITLAYGPRILLEGVQLVLHAGEMVYLVGKSGQGKSSLVRSLIGEIPLQGQRAMIMGQDLLNLHRRDLPALRRRIGVVFQDFQLLMDRSVDANLDFVLEATGWKDLAQKRHRKEEVLNLVGLGERGLDMPHRLPGGEQQRLAIGRALLNQPGLLLADEPTGQLDPDSSEEVLSLLVEINRRGTALLMATHDYMTMDRFPARVLRCAGGRLEDMGNILFESSTENSAG
ncbi:MAG: cell division ATP-binding protein FtsE [Bacteroidota bacterium]